jgi:hypothetical protein
MPLRSINNPNNDLALMTVLKNILPIGTVMTSNLVYIQQKYKMSLLLSQSSPIALHLSAGPQEYHNAELLGFDGQMLVYIDYFARWDEQISSIDALWASIAEDLERIKSNAEDNNATEYQGANHTMSIASMSLAPYEDQYDRTFQGLTLVYRRLSILYNLLPYGVGGL